MKRKGKFSNVSIIYLLRIIDKVFLHIVVHVGGLITRYNVAIFIS